jgi:hypothetical protein
MSPAASHDIEIAKRDLGSVLAPERAFQKLVEGALKVEEVFDAVYGRGPEEVESRHSIYRTG